MGKVNVSTTPVEIQDGSQPRVWIGNTGQVRATVTAGSRTEVFEPGFSRSMLTGGVAVTARTTLGTTTLAVDTTGQAPVQGLDDALLQSYVEVAVEGLALGDAAALDVGTTAGTVAAGDDSRFSNPRTPTAHASSHGQAGADPVTLAQAQVTGLSAALTAKADLVAGKIPTAQLPPLVINETHSVESEAEMLTLDAAAGDVAIRVDQDPAEFYLLAQTPASTLANWAPMGLSSGVDSVAGRTGVVTLTTDDIGGLSTALGGKADSNLSNVPGATIRTVAGLGDSATKNVGTTAGTVAAGDDTRLSDQRTPSNGSVSTVKLADEAVTTPKLADDSVTEEKLHPDVVAAIGAEGVISDGSITSAKLAASVPAALAADTALTTAFAARLDGNGNLAVRRGDLTRSVLDYGAVGDGTTDDTTAIQAAVTAAVAGRLRLVFPARTYKITSAITMGTALLARNWQIEGYGATLLQATDNTPIFKFTAEGGHLWAVRGFNFEWANNQTSSHPLSVAIYFDSSTNNNYGWYNFELANLRFGNGYRGICLNEASSNRNPVWGADIKNIHHTSGMTGACIRLVQTTSGQPNIRLAHVYIRGDLATEALLIIQGANVLTMNAVEFNNCVKQEMLLTTCNGVVIDGIRSEGGNLTADFAGLWTFSDCRVRIAGIQIFSKTFTASSGGNQNYIIRGIGANTSLTIANIAVQSLNPAVGAIAFVEGNDVADIQFEGGWLNASSIQKINPFNNTPSHLSRDRGVFGAVVTKTGNYTLTATDDICVVNGTSVTITLPSASATAIGRNRHYVIKNIGASAVTVNTAFGNIDGAATATLNQWEKLHVVNDGSNWLSV